MKIIAFLFFLSIIISGCQKKDELIIDYWIKFNLPKDFIYLPKENIKYQIKDNILVNLKNKDNNINVILMETDQNIEFERYFRINVEKTRKLIWYKLIKAEKINKCKWWYIHTFNIDQNLLNEKKDIYYISQIFINNWTYYIIQLTSKNEKELKKIENKILSTLMCK